jgi:hypothetical protein
MPPLDTDRRGAPLGVRSAPVGARLDAPPDDGGTVFLFFSNRLGCMGSVLVSLVVTAVIVLVLMAL